MMQEKTMICRLCEQRRKLVRSHIIPEFLYKPLYGDERRLLVIPSNIVNKVLVRQKGFYEKLLCSVCEQRISKWENYAEKILFGGNVKASIAANSPEFFIAQDVDYQLMKLFQISILWRAAVSTLPVFSAVNLPDHEGRLREMIVGHDPGPPNEYGCLMMAVKSGDGLLDDLRQPDQVEIDDTQCVRFVMGGFVWLFVISQSATEFKGKQGFIQPDGRLIVLKEMVENLEFFRIDVHKLRGRYSDVLRAARGRKSRGR